MRATFPHPKARRTWLAWPVGAALLLGACQGDVAASALAGPGNSLGGPGSVDTSSPIGTPIQGGLDSLSSDPVGVAKQCEIAPVASGASVLRRLTRSEYSLTLKQLLALDAEPDVSAVPAEAEREGFRVHGTLQTLSAQHLRAYLDVASALSAALMQDATRRAAVLGCEPSEAGCLAGFVERFGRLAFRRPLNAEERDGIVQAATTNGLDANDRFRYALEALLVSPQFLYRAELGAGDGELKELSGYELASRLSFAALGHGPSELLLDMAGDGALDTPSGLDVAIDMLSEQVALEGHYEGFFAQWLGYERLITPKEPPADWNDALLDDMREETRAVLSRFVWGENSFLELLATNETRLTPALATYYGLPAPDATGWTQIPDDHPRADSGLLSHASLLSKKTDGDPIALRGNWLRSTFLCKSLHIPPEVAASFGERLVGLTHTEIVRERNTDAACKRCHAQIDPIGVGLDYFDPTGRIDPAYEMPDYGIEPGLPEAAEPGFDGAAELAHKLAALPEVATCLSERSFLYVYGREPEAEDVCTVAKARAAFVDGGDDYRALLKGLIGAPAFQVRREPESEGVSP